MEMNYIPTEAAIAGLANALETLEKIMAKDTKHDLIRNYKDRAMFLCGALQAHNIKVTRGN